MSVERRARPACAQPDLENRRPGRAVCGKVRLLWCVRFFSSLRDRWDAGPFQSKQTGKHANSSPSSIRLHANKVPLKEQSKSNDCQLHDDSPADRLPPIKLDIRLPLKEVNRQQASSGGGQRSELFFKLSYINFSKVKLDRRFIYLFFAASTRNPAFITGSCLCGCWLYKKKSPPQSPLHSESSEQKIPRNIHVKSSFHSFRQQYTHFPLLWHLFLTKC